jgi:hypothetical protein
MENYDEYLIQGEPNLLFLKEVYINNRALSGFHTSVIGGFLYSVLILKYTRSKGFFPKNQLIGS